jgi:hypothetical protein
MPAAASSLHDGVKPQRRQEPGEDRADSLTTGKLNAVRAAFKAGVKPSAIARQFGISQSDVRRVLAQGPRSNEVCEALSELRDPPHFHVDDSGDDGSGVDVGAVSAKTTAKGLNCGITGRFEARVKGGYLVA